MLFNSFEFLFIFLPTVWMIYFSLKNHRAKLALLATSSYIFYGYWNFKFIPLLLFSTSIDFFIAKKLEKKKDKKLLIFSLITNLGILGFFKYFNFFTENLASLSGTGFIPWNIILPVGISFYTFQSMSYTIDIYRGNKKPYNDFLAFATYVSFFPQLIAGPIVRHDELMPQLIKPKNQGSLDWEDTVSGLQRFILGLSKKIIIADQIGNAVDQALIHLNDLSSIEAWMCALGYTFQIYFDFSGYSDMAIGLGRMFGFKFPENFNSPYKSKSITQFWRRWHMTLSFWLRDYLYISLGGNRKGHWKTYRNLIVTMLLGGLWHGANWVFVIWGLYHGILLALERFLKEKIKLPSFLKFSGTFFLIVISWVFFRSPDLMSSKIWLIKLFSFEGGLNYAHFNSGLRDKYAIAMILALIISFYFKNTGKMDWSRLNTKTGAIGLGLIFVYIVMELGEKSPFLYFQF